MNGLYGINEGEAYDEAFDETFDESFDESSDEAFDEARRGRRGLRPVGVPRARSAYQPRPSAGVVTQAQLQSALARVSQQINTNAKAIKLIDGRVRSVAAEQTRVSAGLRRETADRKGAILCVRKDLQGTRETGAIAPILSSVAGGGILGTLAPILLLGGDVTSEGSCGGSTTGGATNPLGSLGGGGLALPLLLLAASGALRTP